MAREFWSGHPLEEGETFLVGPELHERVWREESRYPLDWVLRVLGSLESFCLRYGLDYQSFLEQRILGLNGGCLLSSRASLRFAGRFLAHFLQSPDIRITTLRLLDEASRNAPAGGLVVTMLRHERRGDRVTAWLRLEAHPADANLSESDLCSWVATALAHAPRRWGAERFDAVEVLADLRTMDYAVSPTLQSDAPIPKSTGWVHGGAPLSRRMRLRDWVVAEGLSDLLPEASTDDREIDHVLRDWVCPQRGRVVLARGSILGAPWGLFRVRWSLDDASPIIPALGALILEVTDEDQSAEWAKAARLQKQLLEDDRHRLRFVYHASDETVSCNGTHLLRGVPAKILQKVLLAHTVTGRTLFEHREFRRDPDLNLDPANPNLESRLRILSQRLEEKLPVLSLVKAGRGRFQLETSIQIEYTEESSPT